MQGVYLGEAALWTMLHIGKRTELFQGPADVLCKSLPLSTIELIPWRMAARDIEKSFVLTLLRIAHVTHVS
jgi:hypothetical protein